MQLGMRSQTSQWYSYICCSTMCSESNALFLYSTTMPDFIPGPEISWFKMVIYTGRSDEYDGRQTQSWRDPTYLHPSTERRCRNHMAAHAPSYVHVGRSDRMTRARSSRVSGGAQTSSSCSSGNGLCHLLQTAIVLVFTVPK